MGIARDCVVVQMSETLGQSRPSKVPLDYPYQKLISDLPPLYRLSIFLVANRLRMKDVGGKNSQDTEPQTLRKSRWEIVAQVDAECLIFFCNDGFEFAYDHKRQRHCDGSYDRCHLDTVNTERENEADTVKAMTHS